MTKSFQGWAEAGCLFERLVKLDINTTPVQSFKLSLCESGLFYRCMEVPHCSEFQNVSTKKNVPFQIQKDLIEFSLKRKKREGEKHLTYPLRFFFFTMLTNLSPLFCVE